jgi:hypothetical protein
VSENEIAVADYGDDATPDVVVAENTFAKLDVLAREAERAIAARAKAEADLERAKAHERQILERDIPEMLDSMRMTSITTSSGLKVTVDRKIRATLPATDKAPEKRIRAIAWLLENGHGGVVKNEITVALDRGQDDRAAELAASLRASGFDPAVDRTVHSSTLAALVRELLENGHAVPMDLFNVFDQRVAKVVRGMK